MNASVNRLILSGRLIDRPVEQRTSNDKVLWKFSVAMTRMVSGATRESTVSLTTWNHDVGTVLADTTPGTPVLVEGRLDCREWVGRDGVRYSAVDVIAERVAVFPHPVGGRSSVAGSTTVNATPEVIQLRPRGEVRAEEVPF